MGDTLRQMLYPLSAAGDRFCVWMHAWANRQESASRRTLPARSGGAAPVGAEPARPRAALHADARRRRTASPRPRRHALIDQVFLENDQVVGVRRVPADPDDVEPEATAKWMNSRWWFMHSQRTYS
jgi:hypothetical protein